MDYQLNKVSGHSMNIFDSDLDLKAFPELFPTGENGIKDNLGELKILTTDFIRSRLLNRNSTFPAEHKLFISLFSGSRSKQHVPQHRPHVAQRDW